MVSSGFLTSRPHKVLNIDGMQAIASHIEPGRKHLQMTDPIEILSEANSRETVIEKFLASYHALENYMVRVKLAKPQRRRAEKTLRIRDLKVLGVVSDESESNHLKHLFNELWRQNICGTSLLFFTQQQLAALRDTFNYVESEFVELLDNLGIVTKNGDPKKFDTDDDLRANFSTLVYQVRCSIVHHKATEYHISNKTLENPTIRLILTKLLIPVMSSLAFGLPLVESDNPLRYDDQNLRLF